MAAVPLFVVFVFAPQVCFSGGSRETGGSGVGAVAL